MKRFIALLFSLAALTAAAAAAAPHAAVVATGSPAPAIQSPVWLDGKVHRLSDFTGKKTVLLFILNCDNYGVIAISHINNIFKQFSPDEVAMLAVFNSNAANLRRIPGVNQLPIPVCADHKLLTAKTYKRQFDELPMAVIIDKQGRINWRGSIKHAPAFLRQILSGKFDLQENIRVENFSIAVSAAVRAKDFRKACQLIRAEWERTGEFELLSLMTTILCKNLRSPKEALALIAEAHRKTPRKAAIYELEFRILAMQNDSGALNNFFLRVLNNFKDQPLVLLNFVRLAISRPAAEVRLDLVRDILAAGWQSDKFQKPEVKARYAIEYAKVMHNCGRPDLAYKLAEEAAKLYSKQSDINGAKAAMTYYKKVMTIAPTLKL